MKNAILLLLGGSLICARAESLVVPTLASYYPGNNSVATGFSEAGTLQLVYGSKNFRGSLWINSIAFRLDQESSSSVAVSIPRIRIRMSTTSATFSSFNTDYDGNKGPDDITVFDGPISWSGTDLPGNVPNPFELKIQFAQPFAYDTAKGALLLNYETFGPFNGGVLADAHAHGDFDAGWLLQPGAKGVWNLATQFDITQITVPEPGTNALIVTSCGIFLLCRFRPPQKRC